MIEEEEDDHSLSHKHKNKKRRKRRKHRNKKRNNNHNHDKEEDADSSNSVVLNDGATRTVVVEKEMSYVEKVNNLMKQEAAIKTSYGSTAASSSLASMSILLFSAAISYLMAVIC